MSEGTRTTQRSSLDGPCVVGIDFSSHSIELVRLDENQDRADWRSIALTGDNAWQRIRSIRERMPASTWWSEIYLCAIERPFARSRNDSVRLAEGAVLACIPHQLETWEIAPQTWKAHLRIPAKTKPSWADLPDDLYEPDWSQDARDALAIALYARDVNAAGIAATLAAG